MSTFVDVCTVAEAAEKLGVSPRRVRAMITDGRLPGDRSLGRWVIPTAAVDTFDTRPAGRPLAQKAAWQLLGYLAGTAKTTPEALQHRVLALAGDENPETTIAAWTSRRGQVLRLKQPHSAENFESDPRIVFGGPPSLRSKHPGPTHGYVAAADLQSVTSDHALSPAPLSPEIELRVVTNPDLIPRDPSRPQIANAVVAAIDLLDSAGPDPNEARRIIKGAVESAAAWARTRNNARPNTTYADRRPYTVAQHLDTLRGPTSGIVELPLRLDWTPNRTYDLDDNTQLRAMYPRVLREALREEDLDTFLNRDTLIDVWDQIHLPRPVRELWEKRFPELAPVNGDNKNLR